MFLFSTDVQFYDTEDYVDEKKKEEEEEDEKYVPNSLLLVYMNCVNCAVFTALSLLAFLHVRISISTK